MMNPQQQRFVAAYIGEAKYNATEAARIAGYKQPHSQGPRLLENVEVKVAVREHLAAAKAQGIAVRQNRIDGQVRRHQLLDQVIAERAADDFTADVPGGKTGLIVKQLKKVTHVYLPGPDDKDGRTSVAVQDQWEAALDTGLLKEMRELEKHTAQEMGEWIERGELTGKDGGSIKVEFPERRDGPQ